MAELLATPYAQLVLWGTGIAVFTAVAVYLVGKVRGEAFSKEQPELAASDLLTKFRELHGQGGLSDAEFRTIKTKLTARLQDELKENGETG